jgi:hypothetical protein
MERNYQRARTVPNCLNLVPFSPGLNGAKIRAVGDDLFPEAEGAGELSPGVPNPGFEPISSNFLDYVPRRCSPRQPMTEIEDEDEFEDDYD